MKVNLSIETFEILVMLESFLISIDFTICWWSLLPAYFENDLINVEVDFKMKLYSVTRQFNSGEENYTSIEEFKEKYKSQLASLKFGL